MSIDKNKWILQMKTTEDENYMLPLFSFVFNFFEEIFGTSTMNSEPCILYNNGEANYPMLIINKNPIQIRTSAENLSFWSQFIYQLSHEMTHYVIRQYKTAIVKWFEETVCEAMSLYILHVSSVRWTECDLYPINFCYGKSLECYWKNEYEQTEDSVLKHCHTIHELELIEEKCETNRKGRSIERNYLFDTFCVMPSSIAEFVYYPLYMSGNLQIDFDSWESKQENNMLIPHLKTMHPELTA